MSSTTLPTHSFRQDRDDGEKGVEQGQLQREQPLENRERAETPGRIKDKGELTSKKLFVLFVFLLFFPLLALALSCIFGGLLVVAEDATFLTGFLYVASNLLNMANPLTDFNPADAAGVVIDIYVSTVALLLFGIVLNVVNLFNVPIAINRQIERCVRGSFIVPLIAVGMVIPACVGIIAVVFGSILAGLEGWSVHDGIYYVLGNLLGLSNALTDVNPGTLQGDIVDIIVSSMALGCVAIFVDYVTVLNPARYIRKRLKEVLANLNVVDSSGHDIYDSSMSDDDDSSSCGRQ